MQTAADNLRGQGATVREAIIELSQAISALGDHSTDLFFSTMKNLSVLVAALRDSGDLQRDLNQNLASVSELLVDDPNEVGKAISALNAALGEVHSFMSEKNGETLGTVSDKLASVSQALADSLGDIKQTLHIAPNELQNLRNTYQPAQGTLGGAYAFNNFANRWVSCAARYRRHLASAPNSRPSCVSSIWRRS